VVVLVVLNCSLYLILFEIHSLLHFLHKLCVYCQLPSVERKVLVFGLVQQVKRVASETIDVDSLLWISYEYLLDYVSGFWRQEFG